MAEQAIQTQHDAASREIWTRFQQMLQKDPYLLDGVANLLHIATIKGQSAIVEEMLSINPRLARSLDSQNSTALHIAAEQGNLEITKILVRIAPEICWWRDSQGLNPVHVAAINGHVEILKELIKLDPVPAMEKVDRGQTVLHLCVKHRQFRALKFLLRKMNGPFIGTKNDDGETLLHLAAQFNDVEMVKFLVKKTYLRKKTTDNMGRRAMDMVRVSTFYPEMRKLLMSDDGYIPFEIRELGNKMSDGTMVVVVLIATMAFQAIVSPPGGVWQDDSPTHRAGEAVMASSRPKIFRNFLRANNTAFISSLLTIFLLCNKLVSGRRHIVGCSVYLTWVSVASIAVSYGASITVITPNMEARSLAHIIILVVVVSIGLMIFIVLVMFETCLRRLLARCMKGTPLGPYLLP